MRHFKNRTILLIDDDPVVRVLMRKIVEGAGYEVVEADGVAKGLQKAIDIVPHAIICDIVMGSTSGYDFLTQKRSRPEIAAIPVIMASSLQDRSSVYRAVTLGASDYITKPFEARIVVQKLAKLFHSKDFLKKEFDFGRRPVITAKLKGTIVTCSEGGFVLDAPVRLQEGRVVDVQGPALREIEAQHSVIRRSDRPARITDGGHFYNDLIIAGVTASMLQALKKNIKGW